MEPTTRQQIAKSLFDAHTKRERYQPLPEEITTQPLATAYAVQAEFNRLQEQAGVGEAIGYKIALTSKAMQDFVGVDHPLAGVVYASRLHPSPAKLSLSDYQHIGVEFEVTVRLGRALPAGDHPHTRESVAETIASCAASYELVEDRDADFSQVNAFNLIAENNWNAGLILGEEVSDWQGIDLEDGTTQLWINDESAGQGRIGDALGHPLEAVAWLANLLNEHGRQLEANMVVMTGSSITTKFPTAGDRYRFEISGLGQVSIDWDA